MGADTSSANIPAAFCIITADLAPRRHPRNEVINPAAPVGFHNSPGQIQIGKMHDLFPILIASNSQ
jgi:hypothetical protein